MEKFKQVDINRYEEKHYLMKQSWRPALDLTMEPEVAHIELPEQVFHHLIATRRPEYQKYLPYKVHVQALTEETEWTKGSAYLGLNDSEEGTLELFLRPERRYNACELLWVLLHEFRHSIQNKESSIRTNVEQQPNYEMWLNWMVIEKKCKYDTLLHVLHEILPYEIDANTFACELMDIEYPGSKFDITHERLKLLNKPLKEGVGIK